MAKKLSAIHHARWMGASIYILKMFICQEFFDTSSREKADIKAMTTFIVFIYFYYWFKCPTLSDVPALTLKLYKDLKNWERIDRIGVQAAIRKLDLHLDYLTGRNVVLSFASKEVENEEKAEMAKKLMSFEKSEIDLGKPELPRVYHDSNLHDFITEESWHFFSICNLDHSFLSIHPTQWAQDESYLHFCKMVRTFTPLNDAAERAVKLGTDFHGSLAKDFDQHEAVLQSVEAHRRILPKPTKGAVNKYK